MNKIKIYFLSLLGILLIASCEKLVEVDYPANQIGAEQVFEDLQTANAALAGLYAGLRDQSILTGGSYYGAGALLGAYADDLDCYFYDQNGVVDISNNQQQKTNSNIETIWNTAYQQVYYANSIIYGAEHSTTLSESDKNQIKGEALLVRSLIYFYLQQLFGDIPYTASLDYEYNRKLSKTDGSAVLEQLKADLEEAISLLTDEYRDTERIYPNRKAAELLLARIYILGRNGRWQNRQRKASCNRLCTSFSLIWTRCFTHRAPIFSGSYNRRTAGMPSRMPLFIILPVQHQTLLSFLKTCSTHLPKTICAKRTGWLWKHSKGKRGTGPVSIRTCPGTIPTNTL